MLNVITVILTGSVRAGTPILLATLGGIVNERSGISNIGIEGMMLMGALFGFIFSFVTGSPWIGVFMAGFAAMILSLLHALLTVVFNANQIVSGMVLNFLGAGLSSVIGGRFVGKIAAGFNPLDFGPLEKIPVLGPVLFDQDILVYVSLLIAGGCMFFLYRTRWGLNVRAVGDNPVAADSAGLPVKLIRICCTAVSGVLCGFAGAYISLAYTTMWQPEMTAGKGWIAVAMIIFAQWNPLKAIYSAYLFGGITALQLAVQVMGLTISPHILQMFPYIFTILVLSFAMVSAKRKGSSMEVSVGPASLAKSYTREKD
jgi:simple sugar transport system permease protein